MEIHEMFDGGVARCCAGSPLLRHDVGVSERIHDDEPDTGEATVRKLLDAQRPEWASLPMEYLRTSGTDNAMWRLRRSGDVDLVVRLPRRSAAADGALREVRILQHLPRTGIGRLVATPTVRHVGEPHPTFPFSWSVLEWIDGTDAWSARGELAADDRQLADDVAAAVRAIGEIDADALDLPRRRPGTRGGSVGAVLDSIESWLADPAWSAQKLVPVASIRRLVGDAREIEDTSEEGVVHGDLIPGNLLVNRGRLGAIIDWGGVGIGDVAQDLAPAWAVFGTDGRRAFRTAVDVDDASWMRGRIFELEHAVGGVLYYAPRKHVLGDVMSRTLDRILADD
jgi:aminoglycoside phosphotransferase (APT) family kinase protein